MHSSRVWSMTTIPDIFPRILPAIIYAEEIIRGRSFAASRGNWVGLIARLNKGEKRGD